MDKNVQFNVGQVVYLLNSKNLLIIPTLVVEEIVRKTIEDVVVEYIIELPDAKRTRMTIDSSKALLFSDINILRDHMISNSTKSIDKMIDIAVEKKDTIFGSVLESKKKSKEVLDVFVKKMEKIKTIKEKGVQNAAPDVIIDNITNEENKKKRKEVAAE